jgi:uncharacterized membrane protein YedE/YeeE
VKRNAVAYVSGLLFALGLGISGMTHPSKVLAFLDVAGDWDPSLALVMGSGVLVNLVLFRWVTRRGAPLLAPTFSLPTRTAIDAALLGGSAIFGVGWGLAGFCPGPAIVSVVTGATPVIAFVVTMLLAMGVYDWMEAPAAARRPAPQA